MKPPLPHFLALANSGVKRFAPHFDPISVKSYRNILDYDPILETCDNCGSNESNIFDLGSIGRKQQDFQKKKEFLQSPKNRPFCPRSL